MPGVQLVELSLNRIKCFSFYVQARSLLGLVRCKSVGFLQESLLLSLALSTIYPACFVYATFLADEALSADYLYPR